MSHYLPDLSRRLELPCKPTPLDAGQTPEQKLHCTTQRASEISVHAETQLFLYNLLLAKLLDDGDKSNAK